MEDLDWRLLDLVSSHFASNPVGKKLKKRWDERDESSPALSCSQSPPPLFCFFSFYASSSSPSSNKRETHTHKQTDRQRHRETDRERQREREPMQYCIYHLSVCLFCFLTLIHISCLQSTDKYPDSP